LRGNADAPTQARGRRLTRSCWRRPASSGCSQQRLGSALGDIVVLRLDPTRFVPAPAQGALAVQCHRDDAVVLAALQSIDHAPSHAAVDAERDALARAEGGCDVAFGAYCFTPGTSGTHELLAMHERNGIVRAATVRGNDPHALGAAVWTKLDADSGHDA
jgi:hydroxymethylbilane synthase